MLCALMSTSLICNLWQRLTATSVDASIRSKVFAINDPADSVDRFVDHGVYKYKSCCVF